MIEIDNRETRSGSAYNENETPRLFDDWTHLNQHITRDGTRVCLFVYLFRIFQGKRFSLDLNRGRDNGTTVVILLSAFVPRLTATPRKAHIMGVWKQ